MILSYLDLRDIIHMKLAGKEFKEITNLVKFYPELRGEILTDTISPKVGKTIELIRQHFSKIVSEVERRSMHQKDYIPVMLSYDFEGSIRKIVVHDDDRGQWEGDSVIWDQNSDEIFSRTRLFTTGIRILYTNTGYGKEITPSTAKNDTVRQIDDNLSKVLGSLS